MNHCGGCDLSVRSLDCAVCKFMNRPKTEIGEAADRFYAFMSAEGLSRKLSLYDMRKIFNHFKENWRPL